MGRLIDADYLKKDIAKLHVLRDEKEIRRLYYANPHTSLADFEEILVRVFDAIDSAPTIEVPKWIPCEERLPSEREDVLVTCEVRRIDGIRTRYVCVGQYIPRYCEKALDVNWDEEATEYSEEKDEYYPLEGWYESISNWDDYSLIGISDFVLAWMPLPKPYEETDHE